MIGKHRHLWAACGRGRNCKTSARGLHMRFSDIQKHTPVGRMWSGAAISRSSALNTRAVNDRPSADGCADTRCSRTGAWQPLQTRTSCAPAFKEHKIRDLFCFHAAPSARGPPVKQWHNQNMT